MAASLLRMAAISCKQVTHMYDISHDDRKTYNIIYLLLLLPEMRRARISKK